MNQFVDTLCFSFSKMNKSFLFIFDMLDTFTITQRFFLNRLHKKQTTLQTSNVPSYLPRTIFVDPPCV